VTGHRVTGAPSWTVLEILGYARVFVNLRILEIPTICFHCQNSTLKVTQSNSGKFWRRSQGNSGWGPFVILTSGQQNAVTHYPLLSYRDSSCWIKTAAVDCFLSFFLKRDPPKQDPPPPIRSAGSPPPSDQLAMASIITFLSLRVICLSQNWRPLSLVL